MFSVADIDSSYNVVVGGATADPFQNCGTSTLTQPIVLFYKYNNQILWTWSFGCNFGLANLDIVSHIRFNHDYSKIAVTFDNKHYHDLVLVLLDAATGTWLN